MAPSSPRDARHDWKAIIRHDLASTPAQRFPARLRLLWGIVIFAATMVLLLGLMLGFSQLAPNRMGSFGGSQLMIAVVIALMTTVSGQARLARDREGREKERWAMVSPGWLPRLFTIGVAFGGIFALLQVVLVWVGTREVPTAGAIMFLIAANVILFTALLLVMRFAAVQLMLANYRANPPAARPGGGKR